MLCSGRRFGKTHLCLVQLIVWAAQKSGSLNWYIAPSYKAAKQIAWRQLKTMVPKELFAAKNEVELSIELVNGSHRAQRRGTERTGSGRFRHFQNCVLDEAAYIPQDTWELVIRPALADQRGPLSLSVRQPVTTTSMRCGSRLLSSTTGKPSASRSRAATSPLKRWSWPGGPLMSVHSARVPGQLRDVQWQGLPEFDDANVDAKVEDMGGPVLVGLDFNVGVMAGVICSKVGDTLHQWDEIAVKNSNTDEVAQMLRQPSLIVRIICYIPTQQAELRPVRQGPLTTASSGNMGWRWLHRRARGA